MKIVKKVMLVLIILLLSILIRNISFAKNENITYKAEVASDFTYKIIVDGLENISNDYKYSIIISQVKNENIAPETAIETLGISSSLTYDETLQKYKGETLGKEFKKQGQWYAYIIKHTVGKAEYEMIDGPTEMETPKLPDLGERIRVDHINSFEFELKVNALENTEVNNDNNRYVKYYLGEIKDKALLENLSKNGKAAYNDLLKYAKGQTFIKEEKIDQKIFHHVYANYNIVQDCAIEEGKYYFLYVVVEDEDNMYVKIEDIAPYKGAIENGIKYLRNFKYEEINEEPQKPVANEEKIVNEIEEPIDNTQASKPIPQTGGLTFGLIIILIILIISIIYYYKYIRFKNI